MVPDDLDIRREGRAWEGSQGRERFLLMPEKIEMIRGRLFWDDEERLTVLALLLENLGAHQAVRLGDPEAWREAVAGLAR